MSMAISQTAIDPIAEQRQLENHYLLYSPFAWEFTNLIKLGDSIKICRVYHQKSDIPILCQRHSSSDSNNESSHTTMISARLFRELVDSIILGRPISACCGRSTTQIRYGSSSTRWKARAGRDSFNRDAKVQGLKSRAAFKLLEVGISLQTRTKGVMELTRDSR